MSIQTVHLTVHKGQPAFVNITLEGDDPVIGLDPGRYCLQSYNAEYLQVLGVTWYPGGELLVNPCLQVAILPLKTGETRMDARVQYDVFQPLFFQLDYDITIV